MRMPWSKPNLVVPPLPEHLRPDYSLDVPVKPVIDEMIRRANELCVCPTDFSGRKGKRYFIDDTLEYRAGCDGCHTSVVQTKEESQARLI